MQPVSRCPRLIPSVGCMKHLRVAVQATSSSRSFSTTSQQHARTTRARRQFYFWLATRGKNFRNPLPGSTNYLNAYNNDGVLKRVISAAEDEERAQEQAKRQGIPYEPESTSPPAKETPREVANISEWKKKKLASSGKKASSDAGLDAGDGGNEASHPALEGNKRLPDETPSDRQPFPANPNFVSQPVLTERFREELWSAVMLEGRSVRDVSVKYNVEMSRVGAVVRLIEVQKEWDRIGKPLAIPYAKAVMGMLPKSLYLFDQQIQTKMPHESINDLPVNRATGQQIFYPTSESRSFTRQDAARAFQEGLRPADDRVPHPQLARLYKERLDEIPNEERLRRNKARLAKEESKRVTAASIQNKELASIKTVDTGRWEYRFTPIVVESAGKDGRGEKAVGWRYGAPHMDRKKGGVKIPTSAGA